MASSVPPSRTRYRAAARALLAVVLAGALSAPVAASAVTGDGADKVTSGVTGEPQPLSNADMNPGGANNGGDCAPYCSTRDGSLAQNGQAMSGQEAGSRGSADNKFPPGQAPDGSDGNNGYECDGNSGVGVSNPAHTGCTTAPPERCVGGDTVTVTWPGIELGDPARSHLSATASSAAALLPGTYSVSLTSTDVHHEEGFQTYQTQEQWYVVLTLDGSVVATTGTISDLPDAQTTMTETVGTITLADGADTAVATHVHAASGSWPSADSVEPTTAVFTCV